MAGPDAGKAEDWSKLTTPERAEKMLDRMKAHEAAMTGHLEVLKTFYAGLTAEQKKTFDEFHSAPRRGGMRGRAASAPAAAPVKP